MGKLTRLPAFVVLLSIAIGAIVPGVLGAFLARSGRGVRGADHRPRAGAGGLSLDCTVQALHRADARTTAAGRKRMDDHARDDVEMFRDGGAVFPALPLSGWADTKQTLHRMVQVVGKIRLASSPKRNHWWNVPFHLTGTGITTRPMLTADGRVFTIDFDLVQHQLRAFTGDGRHAGFPLVGQSVASFYGQTREMLSALGIETRIANPRPFDLPEPTAPSQPTPSTPPTTRAG